MTSADRYQPRKRNAQPKGLCPSCGKKGLGTTFPGPVRPYRQCTYCNARVDVGTSNTKEAV